MKNVRDVKNMRKLGSKEIRESCEFKFDNDARDMAIKIFNVAKESKEPFDGFAQQFYELFSNDSRMLTNMLELLIRIAKADGTYHHNEEQLIRRAAILFNIDTSEFERIKAMYVQNSDKEYAILGASRADSDDVIKTKYRKLVKEYHPDTIMAKGLPEEFGKFATEKFREIQQAYEKIVQERKAA